MRFRRSHLCIESLFTRRGTLPTPAQVCLPMMVWVRQTSTVPLLSSCTLRISVGCIHHVLSEAWQAQSSTLTSPAFIFMRREP